MKPRVPAIGGIGISFCARILAISLLWNGAAPPGQAASFRGVGDLPGGNFQSLAQDISGNGQFVVGGGNSNSTSGTQAWRWTAATGAIQGLGDLPGGSFNSWAYGVSTDGSRVSGNSSAGAGFLGFSWSSTTGLLSSLGDLPGGSTTSNGLAISGDGLVIVGQTSSVASGPFPPGSEPFRYTGGVMTALGDLTGGAYFAVAKAISADGSVIIGNSESTLGNELVRWTSGGAIQNLGALTGGFAVFTQGLGISGDGQVIVGNAVSALGNLAYRRTDETGFVLLSKLPNDTYSFANDASFDGSVVVGNSGNVTDQRAFLWTAPSGMRNLRDVLVTDYGLALTGWTLTDAVAVSDDGTKIAGQGTNPAGQEEGWWADLTNLPPAAKFSVRKKRLAARGPVIRVKGTASDDVRIARVEYAIRKKGGFKPARGTAGWSVRLRLKAARNVVFVRAVDNLDQVSPTIRKTIVRGQ